MKSIGWIALLFIVVVFIFSFGKNKESPPHTPDETDAFYASKMFITESLKAPSTAKFLSRGDSTVRLLGNNRWEVISYVDAQNSFGAMLRMHYKCVVECTTGNNWRLISLNTW